MKLQFNLQVSYPIGWFRLSDFLHITAEVI